MVRKLWFESYNGVVFYMTPSFSIWPPSILKFSFFFIIPMESRYDSVGLSLSLGSVTYDSTKFVVFGTRNHHERHATMRYHWYTDGQSKRTSFPIPLLSYKIRGASFSRLHMTVYTRTANSKNKNHKVATIVEDKNRKKMSKTLLVRSGSDFE